MPSLQADDETAIALMAAIRGGEVETLADLLEASTDAPSTWIIGPKGGSRSLLHIVTDWPGYFPNGPAVARLLLDRGCDPSAACHGGGFAETPLHWAASSDDVDVAEVLIDGGADLEAPGGSIAGTPLANAVGYGCWHVARLLVARGAAITGLWQAAALGVLPRIEQMLAAVPPPTDRDVTAAFWQACHGGQRRAAERLLAAGADLNGTPDYTDQAPLDIAGALDTRKNLLAEWLRETGATSATSLAGASLAYVPVPLLPEGRAASTPRRRPDSGTPTGTRNASAAEDEVQRLRDTCCPVRPVR